MVARANGACSAAQKHGSAVLMVRVVDGAGLAVRCEDVEAIRYAMYRFDASWSRDDVLTEFDRSGIVLDVRDVFFDSLQTGEPWTTDDVGYNFRHEIGLDGNGTVGKAAGSVFVCYELKPVFGEVTVLRFQIG